METKYAMVRDFIYGWDWSEFSDDEGVIPVIYNTREEAQASLDEYIEDVNDAYKSGNMDCEYQNDMAIAEVKFNLINK